MTAAINFDNLTLGYDRHPAVHHLSSTIVKGSLTAIVGPNGAGKSTLLKAIAGLIKPLAGFLTRPDHQEMAYLAQNCDVDQSFPMTTTELVSYGVWARKENTSKKERERIAREALASVGLGGFEARPISTLSGGQMQRALFARILAQDSQIILLDEPFAGIDRNTILDLLGIIRGWHEEGRTVLAVIHDHEMIKAHFPMALLLARDLIAHDQTKSVMSRDNLARAAEMSEAFDPFSEICES